MRAGVAAGGADAVFICVRLGRGRSLLGLFGDGLAAVVAGNGHRSVHALCVRGVVHGFVDGGQFLARFRGVLMRASGLFAAVLHVAADLANAVGIEYMFFGDFSALCGPLRNLQTIRAALAADFLVDRLMAVRVAGLNAPQERFRIRFGVFMRAFVHVSADGARAVVPVVRLKQTGVGIVEIFQTAIGAGEDFHAGALSVPVAILVCVLIRVIPSDCLCHGVRVRALLHIGTTIPALVDTDEDVFFCVPFHSLDLSEVGVTAIRAVVVRHLIFRVAVRTIAIVHNVDRNRLPEHNVHVDVVVDVSVGMAAVAAVVVIAAVGTDAIIAELMRNLLAVVRIIERIRVHLLARAAEDVRPRVAPDAIAFAILVLVMVVGVVRPGARVVLAGMIVPIHTAVHAGRADQRLVFRAVRLGRNGFLHIVGDRHAAVCAGLRRSRLAHDRVFVVGAGEVLDALYSRLSVEMPVRAGIPAHPANTIQEVMLKLHLFCRILLVERIIADTTVCPVNDWFKHRVAAFIVRDNADFKSQGCSFGHALFLRMLAAARPVADLAAGRRAGSAIAVRAADLFFHRVFFDEFLAALRAGGALHAVLDHGMAACVAGEHFDGLDVALDLRLVMLAGVDVTALGAEAVFEGVVAFDHIARGFALIPARAAIRALPVDHRIIAGGVLFVVQGIGGFRRLPIALHKAVRMLALGLDRLLGFGLARRDRPAAVRADGFVGPFRVMLLGPRLDHRISRPFHTAVKTGVLRRIGRNVGMVNAVAGIDIGVRVSVIIPFFFLCVCMRARDLVATVALRARCRLGREGMLFLDRASGGVVVPAAEILAAIAAIYLQDDAVQFPTMVGFVDVRRLVASERCGAGIGVQMLAVLAGLAKAAVLAVAAGADAIHESMQLVYRQPFRVSRSAAHPALEEILDVFLVRFIIQEQIVTSGLRLARFSPVVERMRSLHIVADRAFAVFVKVMRFRAVFVFGAAFQQRAAGRTLRPINDMIAVRVLRSIVGEDISSRNVIPHFTFTMMLAPHILRVVAIGVHAGIGRKFALRHQQRNFLIGQRFRVGFKVEGYVLVAQGRTGVEMRRRISPARALRRAPNAAQHQDAEKKRQDLLHASHRAHVPFLCLVSQSLTDRFSTL